MYVSIMWYSDIRVKNLRKCMLQSCDILVILEWRIFGNVRFNHVKFIYLSEESLEMYASIMWYSYIWVKNLWKGTLQSCDILVIFEWRVFGTVCFNHECDILAIFEWRIFVNVRFLLALLQLYLNEESLLRYQSPSNSQAAFVALKRTVSSAHPIERIS